MTNQKVVEVKTGLTYFMYEDLTKNKLHNLIPQHISLFACLNQFKDGLVL